MDPITPAITTTLPISAYIEMFEPIIYPTPEAVITGTTFGFTQIFTTSAPYGATIYKWMMEQVVVNVYLTVAIAFAALMIVIAFVWRRIRAGQRYGQQTVIMVSDKFMRNNRSRL